jgi:transcription elongation factor Elf1
MTTLTPAGSRGAEIYHCPFCGDEDLRPHTADAGSWECRSCLRAFTVKLLGLIRPADIRSDGPVPATDSENPS